MLDLSVEQFTEQSLPAQEVAIRIQPNFYNNIIYFYLCKKLKNSDRWVASFLKTTTLVVRRSSGSLALNDNEKHFWLADSKI